MVGPLLKVGGVAVFIVWAKSNPAQVVAYAHQITLLGCGILAILYGFGFKNNLKYIAAFFLANIIVRLLIGGFWGAPVEGPMTQGFKGMLHHGVDIAVSEGSPIVASRDGVVSNVWTDKVYGLTVIVDHENGRQTLYAHNSKVVVNVGDKVSIGSKLSESGNTGKSSGPHLHFEIRENGKAINPAKYVIFEEE